MGVRAWGQGIGTALVFVACHATQPAGTCETGEQGCDCYPNQACNAGLKCEAGSCVVRNEGTSASGGGGSGSGSGGGGSDTTDSAAGGSNMKTTGGGATSPTNVSGSMGTLTSGVTSAGGSSSATSSGGGGGGGTSNTGTGGAGGTRGSSGGGTSQDTSSGGSAGCPPAPSGGGACSDIAPTDVNLLLMVDISASMVDNDVNGFTRWDLVSGGIGSFVSSDALVGLDVNVGVQFFSYLTDASCAVADYSTSAVGVGPVSELRGAVIDALQAQSPDGTTPTYPALSGAITNAKNVAGQDPTGYTAVVFITDGYPTQCDPADIPSIASLAAASFDQSPSVPVYTIGIDGTYNLDQVASAGGTDSTFFIINDGSASTLTDTLLSIATDPFGG